MDKFKVLLAKPGLLRGLTALFIVAVFALKALGLESIADMLSFVAPFLPADSPVSAADATATLLATVALVRAFVRWITEPPPAAPKP